DKMDPANPTCPQEPDWSDYSEMKLTPVEKGGTSVLLAEGFVDAGLPERLRKALADHDDITEIWLRSPGGDARAGNEAGRIIREEGGAIITRIPAGWTCFSACNFIFMGGRVRIIDDGGNCIVHILILYYNRHAS